MNKNPWDKDYQQRGPLWGGSASSLPSVPDRARILELGCGNGKTILPLVQGGFRVNALDFSRNAALLCRRACPDPDQASVIVADARQVPFRSGSFDVIIATHLAGHLDIRGRDQFSREVFRLLAPGGMLWFRDFSTADFRYGHGEETEPGTFLRKNGIATHYFRDTEVGDLFAGLGVRSLATDRWELRIRGRTYPRAEIVAELLKSP
jgi:SAM-dependent methyltransferase